MRKRHLKQAIVLEWGVLIILWDFQVVQKRWGCALVTVKCCTKTIGIDSLISEVTHLKKKKEEEEEDIFPFGDLLFWYFHDVLPYH